MGFDLATHFPDVVLQLTACAPKRIVDGEEHVGVAVVGSRRSSDIDLPSVRQAQAYAYVK